MATIERAPIPVFDTAAEGVEIDSFAPSNETNNPRATLVIVPYNIRYAVGSFLITGSLGRRLGLTLPARRPGLVERHLRRAALTLSDGQRLPPADIVAFQTTGQSGLKSI